MRWRRLEAGAGALGHPPVPARAWATPVASTVAGSALALLPVVSSVPSLPPFGLLMALGWRLLRAELWHAWAGLPLGLADDLLTGQPLGSGAASWTIVFLVVELIDHRLAWRDFWLDWLIAAIAILFCMTAGALAVGPLAATLPPLAPLILVTILCFPFAERICAALDRWRLKR